jgi:peptidyl-dipeptidase A
MAVVVGCGGAEAARRPSGPVVAHATHDELQAEADTLLAYYHASFVPLRYEASLAAWAASTDVTPRHTGRRTGADTVYSAFIGGARYIERARRLLEHRDALSEQTVRQLETLLQLAASAPQTAPELSRRRVETESDMSAKLDGFPFCLDREPGAPRTKESCTSPLTTNEIDQVLVESDDLEERLSYWRASKEVGFALKSGIVELRELRNGVAREMGHEDFFALEVAEYGMTTAEMMALLERLESEVRPLYRQLHCWAKHRMAERFGVEEVPDAIPAHWIGNRWAQSWPGLVESVDRDALVEGKEPEWLLEQAERFYMSLGFPELPESFWEKSDLYPVPEGEDRDKNDHASAWHLDLDDDVRSLMSVEANWRWFETTHHELGHIYYYLAYSRPEVPPLLRRGANRAFHEGIGTLIEHASGMTPYLVEIGVMDQTEAPDQVQLLLDSALTGPIVFLPFAAGTMSRFEHRLYAGELEEDELQDAWWSLVETHQGVTPPAKRPAGACDACTKTHITGDPAQYYDYALASVLVYQLHDHICNEILEQDPHACNYLDAKRVGSFLERLLRPGATRDWRVLLRETVGAELSAEPMLEYYRPLTTWLEAENRGRDCTFGGEARGSLDD